MKSIPHLTALWRFLRTTGYGLLAYGLTAVVTYAVTKQYKVNAKEIVTVFAIGIIAGFAKYMRERKRRK